MSRHSTTAEQLADRAYAATASYPVFSPEERYVLMLDFVARELDDQNAEVIAACRRKAGIA
jgi:hypothetical protein